MPHFIINNNAQPTGEHEVHNESKSLNCLPAQQNRISLGYHLTCHEAIRAAKLKYPGYKIDGCYYCANECHTR